MKVFALLLASLLTARSAAAQSFILTGLLPSRNAVAAPRATDISATFSQTLNPGSTGAPAVFSNQRGGKLTGLTSVAGSTLRFKPAQDFQPGEKVSATFSKATQSTSGSTLPQAQVVQFRAAAGAATAVFGGGSEATAVTAYPGYLLLSEVNPADMDGDGDLDMVVAKRGGNGVGITLNNGNGTFAGAYDVPVGNYLEQVQVVDLDGDGDLDLLTSYGYGGVLGATLNQGQGQFAVTTYTNVYVQLGLMKTADLDGDGDLDVAVGSSVTKSLYIYLNAGNGAFVNSDVLNIGSNFSYAQSLELADVDGDGDVDLLTGSTYVPTVSVRLNNGQGRFSIGNDVVVETLFPATIAVADVDGDGDVDLLARSGTQLAVCLNDGTGTFTANPVLVPVNTVFYSITPADIDGDGDLDLLIPDLSNPVVNVLRNDGKGTFTSGSHVSVGHAPTFVAAADVDGDGDLDLLANSRDNPEVSIRLNGFSPMAAGAARPGLAGLRAYPNPAHGVAQLPVPAGTREVVLRNALGQVVRSVAMAAGAAEVTLALAGLPAGLYLVQAGAATGRLVVE